ncbi:unnamed protein product [Paramecium octaurelia]|uniref:WD domain, G-beta repeat protein n=1 Tax=Paramecium octaurelia TaxID=43137 RepID=A0A8S1S0M1_PAROT|nr:unnamed protein product [Paramecium octaurelia]
MFQTKMIELEEQLDCSKNHKQPIQMVILDKKLMREEHLLCSICLENFESDTKIIGFKKVLKMIQENQKNQVENIQRLIEFDVEMVEQFLNELHKLRSYFILLFDELLTNSQEWINSLNAIGQHNSNYSFFDELDKIIDGRIQNQFDQESIVNQITTLNNSLCSKINLQFSALKNQEIYSQCGSILINLNLNHHMKLIDNSIKQSSPCYAISFNQSGTLMVSAYNCDIKIWNFEQGKIGHTSTICCLQFSKLSNSFVSAGFDKSIRCWKQIKQNEWHSSLSYQLHTECIDCLLLNKSETQLVSGSRDKSIKIWKIDLVNNQLTYLYSLDKHTSSVWDLQLNSAEDTLVSCGNDKQIIIWKLNEMEKWQFGYVVIQSIQEVGSRLCFLNDDQFIWVTGNKVSKDCISTFELNNQQYQENLKKEVKLIQNSKDMEFNLFPIFKSKNKNLIIVKHKSYVYVIKVQKEGELKIITQLKYESNCILGALTDDGRYLVTWDNIGQKFTLYELLII